MVLRFYFGAVGIGSLIGICSGFFGLRFAAAPPKSGAAPSYPAALGHYIFDQLLSKRLRYLVSLLTGFLKSTNRSYETIVISGQHFYQQIVPREQKLNAEQFFKILWILLYSASDYKRPFFKIYFITLKIIYDENRFYSAGRCIRYYF